MPSADNKTTRSCQAVYVEKATLWQCRWRRWRGGRFNLLGFHLALSFSHGIVVWPRGPWPKAPIIDWWWVKYKDGWRRE